MSRIAVIYYSSTGANHVIAEAFVAGAREAGADVRLRRVPELAPPEVIEKNPAWATGFTSSDERHGGQEATLLALYHTLFHWGSIIVPTGYVDYDLSHAAGGNPYGVSAIVGQGPPDMVPPGALGLPRTDRP